MKIPEKIAKDLKPGTAVVAYSVPTKTGAKHIQFSTAQVNRSEEEPLLPTGFAGGKEQADSVQTNQQEEEPLLPLGVNVED